MAEQFYTILTQNGKAKMANASALGQKVEFTQFALGDGRGSYYNPVESQTELKNEVWRGAIGNVAIDEDNPNWIVIENIIPASVGGFMIREAGVFDDEGNLIAIGKYPETYKPVVADGSAKDLYIRMILEVSNTAVVNLKIDPTVILATKKDIDVLSNRVKKNEDDIRELKEGSTLIEDLGTENKTLSGAINELDDKINDLAGEGRTTETVKSAYDKAVQAFQSGVDRKGQAIVNINSMGGNVDDSMTHSEVIDGILEIETDPSIGTTDAVAGDILSPKKAISQGKLLAGTIPSKGAATITPTTSAQTIAAKQYLSGAQTIAGVSVPVANVLAGITIAGAVGTMPNRGALNQTITTNNGQVKIASGYYTGGVIKAIFANLIASNIRRGVNIGGVVGSLGSSKHLLLRSTSPLPSLKDSASLMIGYNIDSLLIDMNSYFIGRGSVTKMDSYLYTSVINGLEVNTNVYGSFGFMGTDKNGDLYVTSRDSAVSGAYMWVLMIESDLLKLLEPLQKPFVLNRRTDDATNIHSIPMTIVSSNL